MVSRLLLFSSANILNPQASRSSMPLGHTLDHTVDIALKVKSDQLPESRSHRVVEMDCDHGDNTCPIPFSSLCVLGYIVGFFFYY